MQFITGLCWICDGKKVFQIFCFNFNITHIAYIENIEYRKKMCLEKKYF